MLDVLQQGGVVVVGRSPDLLHIAVGAIKEAAGLAQNPAPLGQLDLALLQRLVALVQRGNTLLQALTALGQLVDLGGRRRGESIDIQVEFAERNSRLLHLSVEVACHGLAVGGSGGAERAGMHTKLAFDIVETADILGECSLECA